MTSDVTRVWVRGDRAAVLMKDYCVDNPLSGLVNSAVRFVCLPGCGWDGTQSLPERMSLRKALYEIVRPWMTEEQDIYLNGELPEEQTMADIVFDLEIRNVLWIRQLCRKEDGTLSTIAGEPIGWAYVLERDARRALDGDISLVPQLIRSAVRDCSNFVTDVEQILLWGHLRPGLQGLTPGSDLWLEAAFDVVDSCSGFTKESPTAEIVSALPDYWKPVVMESEEPEEGAPSPAALLCCLARLIETGPIFGKSVEAELVSILRRLAERRPFAVDFHVRGIEDVQNTLRCYPGYCMDRLLGERYERALQDMPLPADEETLTAFLVAPKTYDTLKKLTQDVVEDVCGDPETLRLILHRWNELISAGMDTGNLSRWSAEMDSLDAALFDRDDVAQRLNEAFFERRKVWQQWALEQLATRA